MFDAFDTIEALARRADGESGIILPGHDPAVTQRFPPALTDDADADGRLWRIA
jgi:hypothetical protein